MSHDTQRAPQTARTVVRELNHPEGGVIAPSEYSVGHTRHAWSSSRGQRPETTPLIVGGVSVDADQSSTPHVWDDLGVILYEYGEGDQAYRLSGIDPASSVLIDHPFTTRFECTPDAYGIRTWIKYNISALLVAIMFWAFVIWKRPKSIQKTKGLLNKCHPPWYPTHRFAMQIRRCVTGTGALVPIYDREAVFKETNSLSLRDKEFLVEYGQPEAIDVTNRLFITADMMYRHIRSRYDEGQRDFRLASVACGSSRVPLDVAYKFQKMCEHRSWEVPRFEFHFVDLDPVALQSAVDTAIMRGFGAVTTTYLMDAGKFFGLARLAKVQFDVVEKVGLDDYLRQKSRIRQAAGARSVLKEGGVYIVAQINHTVWGFSVKYRTGWPGMRRRRPRHLMHNLCAAGFDSRAIEIEITRACGAHTVACATRSK